MENYLQGITPEMTKTVDKLISSNFEDATPEEIEIYGEWNRIHALHDADLQQKAEVRERESAERRELYRQQAESAMNALDALADLAKAKLKAVENGA